MSEPPPLSSPEAPRRGALVALIVLHVLQLASLVPWIFAAGFSFMAFDAPGSAERTEPWIFVIAIWSYPLWLLAAGVASWICFALWWRKTAVTIATVFTLPTAFIAFVAAAMVIGPRG